ncbi:uncharacterized protein JCM6883_005437 [Sporobolomyces salmoneus]|uniref:uncharacterized protein n=1 Tax=Sporobolomyces salmoneus TaxID=183962 RepID=UPI00317007A8
MRNKKSTPNLRQQPPSPSDAFFPPTPTSITFVPSGNAAYNGAEFDLYMKGPSGGGGGKENTVQASQTTKGGLGKKLLSFPWTKSDKKHSTQQVPQHHPPPLSPTTISSPISSTLQTTASLPLGFPNPPPAAGSSSLNNMARQHPSAAMINSQSNSSHHANSNSSLSTFRTTSSFASTALFASSNDGWDSEATSLSLTSSPESGRDSCGEATPHRMWRVKQEQLDPVREEEEARSVRYSLDGRRNSTPIPRMVAAMLADPETPPRPKRFSTSSKPSPTSPPFDPVYEQAAARQRKESERQEGGGGQPSASSNVPGSPGDAGDADDEVSPPRQRGRYIRRDRSEDSLHAGLGLSSKTRIPSIRFEGLSMDAVFAEVEKKINGEDKSVDGLTTTNNSDKKARRRSHVLSLYKPLDFNFDSEPVLPPSPSPSSSTTTMESLRSGSVTPTMANSFDLSRPRPVPRRTSSRPSPVNILVANTVSNGPASAPVFGTSAPVSPTTPTRPTAEVTPATPTQLLHSPPLAGSFSPQSISSPFSTSSPSLGQPFTQSPGPSPALSTTSTFRPCEIPEVCVFPPSPEQRDRNPSVSSTRYIPGRRSSEPTAPSVMVSGPTKVTVVQEKKVIRVSSRAPSKRIDRQRVVTPPSAPLYKPAPLELGGGSPTLNTPPLSPSLDSPTIPSFSSIPYNPPSIARTDFHPALSSLRVEQAHEEDSSDCEESLNHMLMRLQRPHTPPLNGEIDSNSPLTENALQLHTASQKRVSLIARGMDSNEISPTPSPSRSLSSLSQGKENVSPLSVRRMNRKSRVYESDDSATRYGDAPLTISVPSNSAFSQRTVQGMMSSSEEEEEESGDDYSNSAATKQAQVDLEREIEDTLASIAASNSTSTFSSISSSSATSPSPKRSSRHHRRTQDDSISSTSSFAFTDESPVSSCSRSDGERSKRRPELPHSESYSSNLTCDSFDSTGTETEEAIVCLGERIECTYNVGVIGMAM